MKWHLLCNAVLYCNNKKGASYINTLTPVLLPSILPTMNLEMPATGWGEPGSHRQKGTMPLPYNVHVTNLLYSKKKWILTTVPHQKYCNKQQQPEPCSVFH